MAVFHMACLLDRTSELLQTAGLQRRGNQSPPSKSQISFNCYFRKNSSLAFPGRSSRARSCGLELLGERLLRCREKRHAAAVFFELQRKAEGSPDEILVLLRRSIQMQGSESRKGLVKRLVFEGQYSLPQSAPSRVGIGRQKSNLSRRLES